MKKGSDPVAGSSPGTIGRFLFRPRGAGDVEMGPRDLGVDKLLQEETGLPVHIAEDPLTAVALGTGKVLSEIKYLRKVTITPRLER